MYLPSLSPGQVLIGVSIAVPDPWAGHIQTVRRQVGDPWADEVPPHITVIGPTAVDTTDLPAIYEHLDSVASNFGTFGVEIHGVGSFRPVNPVVYMNIEDGATKCAQLEQQVRNGPLSQDLRFPYHPHITVAHEVPEDQLDRAVMKMRTFQARFRVSALWLYEHCDDGVWRRRKRFDLRWA
ncbi:MAG: 2'-5' RNA ligase family protein [Cellulomonadaceae bacterium]|jgi:2'-5' RNA ligase|nr:2'-5' RNA ligase family protein [Cellulomonadaceae bacterium]